MIVDALMQFEDVAEIQVLALRALCVLCRYPQKYGNPRNDMAVETVLDHGGEELCQTARSRFSAIYEASSQDTKKTKGASADASGLIKDTPAEEVVYWARYLAKMLRRGRRARSRREAHRSGPLRERGDSYDVGAGDYAQQAVLSPMASPTHRSSFSEDKEMDTAPLQNDAWEEALAFSIATDRSVAGNTSSREDPKEDTRVMVDSASPAPAGPVSNDPIASTPAVLRKASISAFTCPITQAIMSDPHSTADGMTYEKTAIEKWL